MTDDTLLERITLNPAVMVGKPVIRGTRLTVQYILTMLAHGRNTDDILKEYKGLEVDDIRACLLYSARMLDETEILPLASEST